MAQKILTSPFQWLGLGLALERRPFLCLKWEGKLYQLFGFPSGLFPATRIFTKKLKPLLSFLRGISHESSAYADDMWMLGKTFAKIT